MYTIRHLLIALLVALVAPAAMAGEHPELVDAGATVTPAPLELVELKMGTGVVKRRLQGEGTVFSIDNTKVHAYAIFNNRKGPPRTATMVWYKDGKRRWSIDLKVGKSKRWRTWSKSTLRRVSQIGEWTVKVLDEHGNELGSTRFSVTEPPGC